MAKKSVMVLENKEEFFYAADGKVLRSIEDLHLALRFMDDIHFYYHVNEDTHDFASWINDVLGEKKLAEKVVLHTNKEKVLGELSKFLNK